MKTENIPLTDIDVGSRQRKNAESNLGDLVASIEANGLINPLIVQSTPEAKKPYILVAGERRFNALNILRVAETVMHKADQQWQTVDVRVLNPYVDSSDTYAIELHENLCREKLTAKEEFDALAALMDHYGDKTQAEQAQLIGVSASKLSKVQTVLDLYDEPAGPGDDDPIRVKQERARSKDSINGMFNVANSHFESKKSAGQQQSKVKRDHGEKVLKQKLDHQEAVAKAQAEGIAPPPEPPKPQPEARERVAEIIHTTFQDWVASYDGPPFSFIHLDFPYGINVGRGYADSERDYKDPMELLVKNADRLIAEQAHIMCWHSPIHREYTIQMLESIGFRFGQYRDVVWHKGSGQGGADDLLTHSYEVAAFGSKGKRPAFFHPNNSVYVPRSKNVEHHDSRKEPEMLHHFFVATVDENTRVLDPTCGGGTSIQVAWSLHAKYALGLEMNQYYVTGAKNALDKHIKENTHLLGDNSD